MTHALSASALHAHAGIIVVCKMASTVVLLLLAALSVVYVDCNNGVPGSYLHDSSHVHNTE